MKTILRWTIPLALALLGASGAAVTVFYQQAETQREVAQQAKLTASDLRRDLADTREIAEQLELRYEQSRLTRTELAKRLARTDGQVAALKTQLKDEERRLTRTREKLAQNRQEKATIEQHLSETERDLSATERSLAGANQKLAATAQKLSAEQERAQRIQRRLDREGERRLELQGEIAALDARLNAELSRTPSSRKPKRCKTPSPGPSPRVAAPSSSSSSQKKSSMRFAIVPSPTRRSPNPTRTPASRRPEPERSSRGARLAAALVAHHVLNDGLAHLGDLRFFGNALRTVFTDFDAAPVCLDGNALINLVLARSAGRHGALPRPREETAHPGQQDVLANRAKGAAKAGRKCAERDVDVPLVGFDAVQGDKRSQQGDGPPDERVFANLWIAHQVEHDSVPVGLGQNGRAAGHEVHQRPRIRKVQRAGLDQGGDRRVGLAVELELHLFEPKRHGQLLVVEHDALYKNDRASANRCVHQVDIAR